MIDWNRLELDEVVHSLFFARAPARPLPTPLHSSGVQLLGFK